MSRDDNSATLVERTAGRLRMLQIDCAGDDPEMRRQVLADELNRVVSAMPAHERQPFLDRLAERFPSWDRQVDIGPVDAASQSAVDASELENASFLVSRLIDLAPRLNERERQAVRDRLTAAGLAPEGGGAAWPEDVAHRVAEQLELKKGQTLDAARVLQALALLADCALRMDRLAWKTWREMAPRSKLRGTPDLDRKLSRFVSGDPDVAGEQIDQELQGVRRLVASLVRAIPGGGDEFGQKHVDRCSVAAIEQFVDVERGGGLLQSLRQTKEAHCWNKYREIAQEIDKDTIRREIIAAIADRATRLMEGA